MKNKISVVIPSTRPESLKYAVRSVIQQKTEFFEIIISDNNPKGVNYSSKFKSLKNVRYFKTSKYLDLVDNWNFAFSKIKGDWVFLLTDKDIVIKSCAKILDKLINENKQCEIFTWNQSIYRNDGESSLTMKNFYGRKKIFQSKKVIKKIFNFSGFFDKDIIPFFPRAIFSNRLIKDFKEINGSFFLKPEPMLSSALSSLSLSDFFCVTDYPLIIKGFHTKKSAGNYLDEKFFLKLYKNTKIVKSPIKSKLCIPSWSYETLINFKEKFPKSFKNFKLNKFNYFFNCKLLEYTDFRNTKSNTFKNLTKEIKQEIGRESFFLNVYVQLKILTFLIRRSRALEYFTVIISKIFLLNKKGFFIVKKNITFYNCIKLIEKQIKKI